MKAKLETPNKPKQEQKQTGTRGRQPIELRFPKKKLGFTVDEVVDFQKQPVSPITVRNRLNAMTYAGTAKARPMQSGGRGHPKYIFTLVA